MEFRFNLNDIFKDSVVEVGSTLIPPGFTGDKRALWDTQSKVTQIVNTMGEASAHAQGLSKPITTADKLRNSEHRLYLLIDQNANQGKGAVTGMLKTGEKSLYVFDRDGQHYQVAPPCVLDFYIHESRQRSGFGKQLFEHMLRKEEIQPVKMAIDRPSDKFLGFLNKHYGLNAPVKQMNNFVVFDEFFPKATEPTKPVETDNSNTPSRKQSANGLQQGHPSRPFGRYGAPRPPCSMGQIIHNDTAVMQGNQKPTGTRSDPTTNVHSGQPYHPYSEQMAWQATQSAPNMQYYPPNPYQNYSMAQGDAPVMPPNYNPQTGYQYMSPPVRNREPLIPQSFDGTPRMPAHYVQSQPLQPQFLSMPVHGTVSAPMQSYHQPTTTNQSITDTSRLAANNYMQPQPDLPRAVPSANTPPNYINQASNPTTAPQDMQNASQAIPAASVVNHKSQNVQESPSTVALSQNIQSNAQPQAVPSAGSLPPNPQITYQPNAQEVHSTTTVVPQNVQQQQVIQQPNPQITYQPNTQAVHSTTVVPQSGTTFNWPQNVQQQPPQVQGWPSSYNQPNPTVPSGNTVPQNAQSNTRFHREPPVQQISEMPQNTQVVPQQSHPVPSSAYSPYDIKGQPSPERELQMIEEEARYHSREVDLSKGYPPQHHEIPAQNAPPKLDRPNSLNFDAVDLELTNNGKQEDEEMVDGVHEDKDSLDGDVIEKEIQMVQDGRSTPGSKGFNSPQIEAAGLDTPGRSSRGLTDQGYFDLKFYHNKLW